ncbi:UV-damage repair protein [Bacillus inaquosorum]
MNLVVDFIDQEHDLLTNITMDIYIYLMLFNKFYSGKTVRSISVTLSNIEDDVNQQLSLFEVDNEKRRKLGFVMDGIRNKYGSKAILRAFSYTTAGTALHRAGITSGHKS